MTFATLRALHAVIGTAIDDIERVYRERSQDYPVDYPSLDEPYYGTAQHTPQEELVESLKDDPAVVTASMRIVAACAQLSATVNKPWLGLMEDMLWPHLSAAIGFLETANIVEILREAGPGGLHVQEIHRSVLELRANLKTAAAADAVPLTAAHLGHILRLLVAGHYLREVKPDMFANNRMSSYLDTGKTLAQLREAPDKKYDNTDGVAAYVAVITNFDLHSGSPAEPAEAPSVAPFNLAFNTGLGYFSWLELPENAGRLARFARGMVGSRQFEAKDQILQGFSWADLPQDSVLVDVGGGIGSQSILVAQAHPHIHVVVEDREHVVASAASAWGPQHAHLFDPASGRMSWRARDFFEPWPALVLPALGRVDAPAVFLLRMILHNWNDEHCRRRVPFVVLILRHLRAAAGAHTTLLLGDILLQSSCNLDNAKDAEAKKAGDGVSTTLPLVVPDDSESEFPPLKLGVESITAHFADILMTGLFNGKERTVDEMAALTLSAGWKIVEVRRSPGSIVCYTTAVPV
ncbi:hypothetical protein GSI_08337 [Ganoderma sinense ZZ0214-1]|uniref:O-methyltransferase C-terminal domain-containing protein n=1 Tax=Ganoderma sinense ZZ0214-1 TaxID=1077348 RepID=A0A2G8S6X7_9APHY|nr:hypothetical protein GSI_08337 [Ganoderma sinense ZZ0214-1]